MSEKPKETSVTAFVDLTAFDAPAPNDDSVSALFGSLSAALAGAVAGLTVDKKKYVEVGTEMREVAAAAEALKEELIGEIDRDPDPFNEFATTMTLPKNTDEGKAARKAAMQNGLKFTAKVPCHITETVTRIFLLAKTVVERGSTSAMTDGLVAAMATRTAMIDAGLNIKVSLTSVEDEDFVAEYNARVAALEKQAVATEHEIFALSELTREI